MPAALLLLVYGLLWLPPVQRKITDTALKEVMKQTHNRLSIGELYFRPFNRLQLKEVYAGDLRGDTLLYAEKVSAGFDLFRLLKKQLLITSVDLEAFVIQVRKDSADGNLNLQFLIDAFAPASPDTVSSALTVCIRDIRLKKGRITYDVLSEPALPDSLFDVNHIYLAAIDSDIDVHSLRADTMDIRLRSLSFVEKSGWRVTQLQASLQSEGGKYRLSDVQLRLPHSQLAMAGTYCDSGVFRLTWENTQIYLPELKMFYPALAGFPEPLRLSGEVGGTLPAIDLSRFQADYGKRVHLQLQASIADYNRWQDAPVRLQIGSSSMDAYMVEYLLHRMSNDSGQALPVRPGAVALTGSLQGTLPQFNFNLLAGSDWGDVSLEGGGGYDFRSKETRFDASLHSESFDAGAFLQDTIYGLASLQLQVRGTLPASGPVSIDADARIDRFDFNGYSYHQIGADAAYRGDSVRVSVYCDDVHLPFTLHASADIGKEHPGLTLDANLESVYLDTLHLLPHYRNAFLTGRLRADIRGFDPERMRADVCIDSLTLTTDKGAFVEPQFHLFYAATGESDKKLDIYSGIMNVQADGKFTYAGLLESMKEHFSVLFPQSIPHPERKDRFPETLDFRVGMNRVNSLSGLLELPRDIPDSVLIIGRYNNDDRNMRLSASAYTRFMETNSLQLSLSLFNKDNRLAVNFNVDNKSPNYNVDGSIDAEVELVPKKGSLIPDMNILFNPTVWVLNEIDFDFNPARMDVREGRYTFHNLTFGRTGRTPSVVTGFVQPDVDSLGLQVNVRDIELQWFQNMLAGSLYGLSGSVGADVSVSGKMSDPAINGRVWANQVQAGICALNTLYSMNDSISFNSEVIRLDQLTVLDQNRHVLTATGTVTHHGFSRFTPNIDLMLNDFLVLSNERQVDSLFYGNLRINGLLTVKQSGKDWLIAGDVTHSNNARFTVNLPSSASTAERYNHMITYINAEPEASSPAPNRPQPKSEDEGELFRLPLKINASLWFDPGLTIGAVFNPLAGDAAHVNGNGRIKFSYDMMTSAMNLLGDYEITSGKVNLSVAKITKKTFVVQNGGKLVFHGNPMETSFNLTALYNLRADLKTLDPSFGNLGIVNTKVPVSCSLTATGNIDRMALEYDIMLPTEPDDIQRKVDGLLYTDNMKIKQIAYLLALGSFMPASSDSPDLSSPALINSLAALTSGGLNKLLAGVLSDKWSIHADLQTGDGGLSDMAINISGSMLNDRLTVNGTVGYHDNTGQTNNLTGDFDVEYKLIPSGNLVLKAYNVTNNQYYEQAATTQGVGVAYKREARTFRKLFDKFKKKEDEK